MKGNEAQVAMKYSGHLACFKRGGQFGRVAQGSERGTHNSWVVGSIPTAPIIRAKRINYIMLIILLNESRFWFNNLYDLISYSALYKTSKLIDNLMGYVKLRATSLRFL